MLRSYFSNSNIGRGILALIFSGCLLTGCAAHDVNNSINTSSDICGRYDETLFVNYKDDLELLSHCRVINTSIFINGGYQIDSLKPLSNLRYIMGYLVIIDSHSLADLNGLHNLHSIVGKELYSNNYSLVIKHNTDILHSWGLCYADLVNWTLITGYDTWIYDNGPFCPICDPECDGCWGPGPQLCQICQHYLSGFTCVNVCSPGTILAAGGGAVFNLGNVLKKHQIRLF